MLVISIFLFVGCLALYYFRNTNFLFLLLMSTWLCGSIMTHLFYDSEIELTRKIGYGEVELSPTQPNKPEDDDKRR